MLVMAPDGAKLIDCATVVVDDESFLSAFDAHLDNVIRQIKAMRRDDDRVPLNAG
jgi:hypothetical protein